MPPKSASPTFATVSDIVKVDKRLPAAVCLFKEEVKESYARHEQRLAGELYHALRKKYHQGGLGKVFKTQVKERVIICEGEKISLDLLQYEPLIRLARILFYGSKRARQNSNPTKALRVLRLALLSPVLAPKQLIEIECFAAFIYFRGDTIQHKVPAPTLQQNLPMALHCLTRACQDFNKSFKAASAEPEEPLLPKCILNYLIFLLAHLAHDLAKNPKFGEACADICELQKILGVRYGYGEDEESPKSRLTVGYLLARCQHLINTEEDEPEPELKDASCLVEILSSPQMLQTFLLDNHEGEGGDDHAEAPHQPDDGAEAGSGRESSDEEVIEFTKTLLTQSMNAPERAMSRLEIILTYVAGIVRQKLQTRKTDGLPDALLQFLDFGVQLISVCPQRALGRAFALIIELWGQEIEPFVGNAELSPALTCLKDIIYFHLVGCRHDLSLIQDGFHEAGKFLPRLAKFASFDMAAQALQPNILDQINLETDAYQQCVVVASRFFEMADKHPAERAIYLEFGLRYLLKAFAILENGVINKDMYFKRAFGEEGKRAVRIHELTKDAAGLFQGCFRMLLEACDQRSPIALQDLKLSVAQIGLPVHPLFRLFENIAGQLKQQVTVYVWMEAFSTVFNLAAMDEVDQALKVFLKTGQAKEDLQGYRGSVKQIISDAYEPARKFLLDKYARVADIEQPLAEILKDPYNVDAYLKLDDFLQTLKSLKPEEGGLFGGQLAEAHLSINLFFSLLYRWKLIDAMPARAGLKIYHARRFLTERRIQAYNPEDPETFSVARLRGLIQERKEENKFKLIPYQSVDMFVAESAVQWSEDEAVLKDIIESAETVPVALMRSAFALCRQVYLELALQLKERGQFDKYEGAFAGMWDLIRKESDASAVKELPQQLSTFIACLKGILPTHSSLGLAERLRDIAQKEKPLWLSLSSVLKEMRASGRSQARASRYVRVAIKLQDCLENRFDGLWGEWGEWGEVSKYCKTLSGELEKNIMNLSREHGFDMAQIKQGALGEFEGVPWQGMSESTWVGQISYYKYMLESLFSTPPKELSCNPADVCVAIFQRLGHEPYGQVLAQAVKRYAADKPMLFAIFGHIHQQCLSELRDRVEKVEDEVLEEFSKSLTADTGRLTPYQKSEAAKFIFDATPGHDLQLLIGLLDLQGAGAAMRINLFACEPTVGKSVCDTFHEAAEGVSALQKLWRDAKFVVGLETCLVRLREVVFSLVKWYSEHDNKNSIRDSLIQQLEGYIDSQLVRVSEAARVEDKKVLGIFQIELEREKNLKKTIDDACASIESDDLSAKVRDVLFENLSWVRAKPIEHAICLALDRLITRESFDPVRSWHFYREAKRDPLLQQKAIRKWRSEPGVRESVEMIFMSWIYRFSTLDSNPMLKEEWLECMRALSMLGPALADTTAAPEYVRSGAGGGSSAGDAADCPDSSVRPALEIAHHLLTLLVGDHPALFDEASACRVTGQLYTVPLYTMPRGQTLEEGIALAGRITKEREGSSVRTLGWVGALQNLCAAVDDMLCADEFDKFAALRLSVCCGAIQELCVAAEKEQTPADRTFKVREQRRMAFLCASEIGDRPKLSTDARGRLKKRDNELLKKYYPIVLNAQRDEHLKAACESAAYCMGDLQKNFSALSSAYLTELDSKAVSHHNTLNNYRLRMHLYFNACMKQDDPPKTWLEHLNPRIFVKELRSDFAAVIKDYPRLSISLDSLFEVFNQKIAKDYPAVQLNVQYLELYVQPYQKGKWDELKGDAYKTGISDYVTGLYKIYQDIDTAIDHDAYLISLSAGLDFLTWVDTLLKKGYRFEDNGQTWACTDNGFGISIAQFAAKCPTLKGMMIHYTGRVITECQPVCEQEQILRVKAARMLSEMKIDHIVESIPAMSLDGVA